MTPPNAVITAIIVIVSATGCGTAKFFGLNPTKSSSLSSSSDATEESDASTEIDRSTEEVGSIIPDETITQSPKVPGPCDPKNARPLAGLTVTLNEATGLLTVQGDDNSNVIVLSGTGAPSEVAIGDSLATRPVIFPCVDQLEVYANGGDDNITFNASPGMINVRGVRVDGGN